MLSNLLKQCRHFGRPVYTKPHIDSSVYNRLCELNINKYKKTKRGTSAGFRKFCAKLKDKSAGNISLAVFNARSIRTQGKTAFLKDYISSNGIDIAAITETWLGYDDDDMTISALSPEGYSFNHVPRTDRKGGGVGVLYKSMSLEMHNVSSIQFSSFEYCVNDLLTSKGKYYLIVVYRPPTSCTKLPFSKFIEEFSVVMEQYACDRVIIVGDFNIHVDDHNCGERKTFMQLLETFNLFFRVTSETHVNGHTLDLVITRTDDNLVSKTKVHSLISDHWSVCSILAAARNPTISGERKKITFRALRKIDKEEFGADMREAFSVNPLDYTVSDLAALYEREATHILDKHAPLKTKLASVKPMAPWYDSTIGDAKRVSRRAERKWRKTRSIADREVFKKERDNVVVAIRHRMSEYYNDLFLDAKGDSKKTFGIIDHLLCRKKPIPLPPCQSEKDLANNFSSFFHNKIVNIRAGLEENDSYDPFQYDNYTVHDGMDSFHEVTQIQVENIIKSSRAKSSRLDPIPTWLLKSVLPSMSGFITLILNKSILTGEFPACLKSAVVTPLIKKISLQPILKNYRPISNPSTLSKVIEKVVVQQLSNHLEKNGLLEDFQSAYKARHSTETALLRVQEDVLKAIDNGDIVCLALLDLSAAFDTVDHDIMIERFSRMKITGVALSWIQSYLEGRYQQVLVGSEMSHRKCLEFGVPQGSVMGPYIFTWYTLPLGRLIRSFGLNYHLFADDTQLYVSFDRSQEGLNDAVKKITDCVGEIGKWMEANKLQLNGDKTEVIFLGPKNALVGLNMPEINIGNSVIQPASSVKNLGVIMDNTLSYEDHISSICKKTNYHLYRISRIRHHLTRDACETAIHALVTSTLDFSNALLMGLPKVQLTRLQLIQNSAARLLAGVSRTCHISPIRQQLHWLPIVERIEFKVLVTLYKCVHGNGPRYLNSLAERPRSCRTLRSSFKNLLHVERVRTVTFGDRRVMCHGARLWNGLPEDVKNSSTLDIFKSKLKTHLFKSAFEY